jgi:hypothetical protein
MLVGVGDLIHAFDIRLAISLQYLFVFSGCGSGYRPSGGSQNFHSTKRQERGIPGIKLLPNLQLIKRLEG